MKLELRTEGVPLNGGLREFVEHKLQLAVGRFGGHVRRVRVRLTDVNGPRKGEDIRCHIQASLGSAGVLTIEEQRADPFAAVSRASARVGRRLAHRIDHLHTRRKGRAR